MGRALAGGVKCLDSYLPRDVQTTVMPVLTPALTDRSAT